jgi:NADH:ubiquinone oxidoreductase subunit E
METHEPEMLAPGPGIDEILARWRYDRSNLIEMLQDVQEKYRHIPLEQARALCGELDIPLSQVFHIASFYKGFTLEPRGRYPISVCTGTACHVNGGTRIMDNVMRDLGLSEEGEVTGEMLFSVESVRCVGCCGLAPVVLVGDEVMGRTSTAAVNRRIKRIRRAEQRRQ